MAIISVDCLCLSVCLYIGQTTTFESLDVFVHRVYLKAIQVKFVYEGHWVKVKVTGAAGVVLVHTQAHSF